MGSVPSHFLINMKVELSFYATNLKNVAGPFGTADPFAVVTRVVEGAAPAVVGRTETIDNTLSPSWIKVFLVDYKLGTPLKIIVSIFHAQKKENKSMGSVVFDIGEVLGSRGGTKAKRMENGTIFCNARKSEGKGLIRLQMKGTKLKNTEGIFAKPDPFFELSRGINSAGGSTWDNVFRSPVIMDTLNPSWETVVVPLSTLCGGDIDSSIQVSVYDHESSGKHVIIGKFETTAKMLSEKVGADFELTHKGKKTGTIHIEKAELVGLQGDKTAEKTALSPAEEEIAVGNSKPTFLDYIQGGCQLNVVVAIDVTGSNGNPMDAGTLHHIDPNSDNPYEKAISSIVGILEKYDQDKKFPVFGFGAKIGGNVEHCFEVAEEAHGVKGVMDAYHGIFKSGLIMSGPTVFTEVMETAAARAQSALSSAQETGGLAYTVLLIITDGAVSDPGATAECLKQIGDSPLSVVIVGVGNADFSSMQFLDDLSCDRDIVQFVEFNKNSANRVALSSATLHEIPGQLTQYYGSKGIAPGKAIVVEEEEIVVEESEIEIDLSLDVSDEEIIVSGTGVNTQSNW